jgi:LysM repeat protein
MNEAFVIDREFLFKNSIYEITSISVEQNYDINGSYCEGEFIVSGDYRLHQISINKEDFNFKIPFKHELRSNVNLDSVELEITDFNYEFKNGDELEVHIEYTVSAEQGLIEFVDEASLDEFLESNPAEIINLSESMEEKDIKEEENLSIEQEEMVKEDNSDEVRAGTVVGDAKEETKDTTQVEESSNIDHNMILNSINSEESYVKYHIHTVSMEDNLENICTKYGVSLNTLKKYNTFDSLELNMKLLIPENEES